MTWDDWICLALVIVGVVLFLYGANYYNETVGWLGVFLFVGAIVTLIVLYVYRSLTKPKKAVKT
jgi:hypothetical protein